MQRCLIALRKDFIWVFKSIRHFQQYFSDIMAISFSGGRSRDTRKVTTDHGQATGKLYHLRVECTLLCNLQSRAQTHAIASSTTKTDRHDIAEILLKVALNTINQSKSNHELNSSILSKQVWGFIRLLPVFSTNSNDRHINEILLKVLSNFYDLKCLMFVNDSSVVLPTNVIKYKYKVCILQRIKHLGIGLGIILFNATFNNISDKSRRSVRGL
jgi:hypothetical protein